MSLIGTMTRRVKRAVNRREPKAFVSVNSIVRNAPTSWVATVTYAYGPGTWEERVSFTRTRKPEHDVITVVDADYPTDRKRAFISAHGANMPRLIIEYLIAGRW